MESFDVLLKGSAKAHGHLCSGQVVGVRMAILGCRLIGIDNPRHGDQIKKLIVYVEIDRCAADAVSYVTGVKLGRRSLKFMDYGIMAATFFNLETQMGYRVLSTEASRDLVQLYAPDVTEKAKQQLVAYLKMPDSVLFKVQSVQVQFKPEDMPGPTRFKEVCSSCGQVIRDGRGIAVDGQILCKPCTEDSYFTEAREVTWPEMDWIPSMEAGDDFLNPDYH